MHRDELGTIYYGSLQFHSIEEEECNLLIWPYNSNLEQKNADNYHLNSGGKYSDIAMEVTKHGQIIDFFFIGNVIGHERHKLLYVIVIAIVPILALPLE